MPDPIRPEIENVKGLIFRACTAWETQSGRKLGDEASVLEFLRALKTDDRLFNAEPATAFTVREALADFEFSATATFSGVLSAFGITGKSQQLFLTALKNSAQREHQIKEAFAAHSPAETARALESIATRDNPQLLFRQFLAIRPAESGKAGHWFIIHLLIIITIFLFIGLGSQLMGMFAYKGVTPDPGGDYA